MQIVDSCPRKVAATHSIHRRGVTGAPFVRETRPILLDPMGSAEFLEFADDAGAPVDDGAEHIEGERCWPHNPMLFAQALTTAPGHLCPARHRRPGSATPGRPSTAGTVSVAAAAGLP